MFLCAAIYPEACAKGEGAPETMSPVCWEKASESKVVFGATRCVSVQVVS